MSQANAKPKYMKTPGGVYYIAGHNLAIRSKDDKTVVGKQNKGEISPLTEEDVVICRELEVDYVITRGETTVLSRSGDEFTIKSKDDFTVTGRWLDNEACLLNEDDVELCNKYGLTYDSSCVSEEDGVEEAEMIETDPIVSEAVTNPVAPVVSTVPEVTSPVVPTTLPDPVVTNQESVDPRLMSIITAVRDFNDAHISLKHSYDALTSAHAELKTSLEEMTRQRDQLQASFTELKKKWDIIMSVAK